MKRLSILFLAAFIVFPLIAGAQANQPNLPEQAQIQRPPEPGRMIADEFIVVLKDDVARRPSDIGSPLPTVPEVAAEMIPAGGELLHAYQHALQGFAARMPEGRARNLANDPRVAFVEYNVEYQALDATQSNPTWGLDRIDQRNLPLDNSYTYDTTASNVHVFIVDTGMRLTHTQYSSRVGAGYTSQTDSYGITDCHGHGTHVAGTVGGSTYGVAKGVTLHPVRVINCSGSGTTAQFVAGADWITANKHLKPAVANASLGWPASTTIDTAVQNSVNAGITWVVSAGNEGGNACNKSPARVSTAITVGSTDSSDTRATSSNYGTCVDIFAPGVSILSSYYSSNTATTTMSGTSMAAPHVAGAAALYLADNPSATPATVKTYLQNKATTGKVNNRGSGSPDRLLYTGDGDSPPNAYFTVSCFDTVCSVNASGSSDDIGISSYSWNWGDGSTSSGTTASHIYNFYSSYTIVLTVTDTSGLTDTYSRSVTLFDENNCLPYAYRESATIVDKLIPEEPCLYY